MDKPLQECADAVIKTPSTRALDAIYAVDEAYGICDEGEELTTAPKKRCFRFGFFCCAPNLPNATQNARLIQLRKELLNDERIRGTLITSIAPDDQRSYEVRMQENQDRTIELLNGALPTLKGTVYERPIQDLLKSFSTPTSTATLGK